MSGIKFEELSDIKKLLFADLKKILSQDDWRDLFVKNEKGLYDFDFSGSKYVRSHVKIEVLKELAEAFRHCVVLNDYKISIEEGHLISVIHSTSFGDAYYERCIGKLIFKYPEEDWLIFTTFILLGQNVKEIDQVSILHHLQCLTLDL